VQDTHYKYLVVLLVPVTVCFVIVNWWGLKVRRSPFPPPPLPRSLVAVLTHFPRRFSGTLDDMVALLTSTSRG